MKHCFITKILAIVFTATYPISAEEETQDIWKPLEGVKQEKGVPNLHPQMIVDDIRRMVEIAGAKSMEVYSKKRERSFWAHTSGNGITFVALNKGGKTTSSTLSESKNKKGVWRFKTAIRFSDFHESKNNKHTNEVVTKENLVLILARLYPYICEFDEFINERQQEVE